MPPEEGSTGIVRRAAQPDYPLTYLQREIWFHCQLPAGAPLHRSGVAATIAGPLDRPLLLRALQAVVDRQSVLRTAIRTTVDGQPRQVVLPELPVDLFYEDLSGLSDTARFQRLIERFQQIESETFELSRAPLWRVALLRAHEREHVLAFFFHHAIIDVFHSSAILAEMAATYCRFANGDLTPPAPLPFEYRDYALWLEDRQRDGRDRESETYWLEQLRASRSDVLIPRDRPAPASRRFTVEGLIREVDPVIADAIGPLSRACRATPYGLLLATFAILLGRLTGSREAFVGQPFSTRPRELQDVAGMYANPLPIRTRLDPRQSFRQLVSSVRREFDEARRRREVSLMDAVRRLCHDGEVESVAPLRASISHVGSIDMQFPGFRVTQTPSVFGATHPYDLWLGVKERLPGISLTFGFATELFDVDSAQRFVNQYDHLLTDAVRHPDRAIDDLEMMPADERRTVLAFGNGQESGQRLPREESAVDLFERQVRRTPLAPAVSMGAETLTYRVLDARATRLAARLRACGVGLGTRVALVVEPSIAAIVGMLAVLKAGGAYAPIEPDTPPLRLRALLASIGGSMLLTTQSLREELKIATGDSIKHIVCLDDEGRDTREVTAEIEFDRDRDRDAAQDTPPAPIAASTALITFASGPSAVPFAIALSHRALMRLARNASEIGVSSRDVVLQASSLASDLAAFEIFGALLNGARLRLRMSASSATNATNAADDGTVLVLPSSTFEQLIDDAPESLAGLRTLIVRGEPASVSHVRRACASLTATQIVTASGLAENATFSTWQRIEQVPADASSIRVGRPLANASVFVFDEHLRPQPIKVKGDVYVGGEGLADGYLNRPDETAARFVPNPFGVGERLFRTGDIARWHPDGSLELLGREDEPLMLRGLRVDPREIEDVIEAHAGVRRAAVVSIDRASDRARSGSLLALITTDGRDVGASLQEHLTRWLPPHLRPSRCLVRDTLPITARGAIDRQKVAAIAVDADQAPIAPGADLTPHISAIWRDVLGVARFGPDDNFFEIGGDSIACVRIATRLRARGLPIRERDFFDHQTVATLAACLQQRGRVAPPAASGVGEGIERAPVVVDDDELVGLLAGEGEA